MEEVKRLVVVQDQDVNEALYADGHRVDCEGDTVYAVDICDAAKQGVWQISMVEIAVQDGFEWPEIFEDLMPFVVNNE